MRRTLALTVCLAFAFAGAVVAQAEDTVGERAHSTITRGELSSLLLQTATGTEEGAFDARSSLLTAQRLGLVPADWKTDEAVTAKDLRALMTRLGEQEPAVADSDAAVTVAEARSQLGQRSELIRNAIASGQMLSDGDLRVETDDPILGDGGDRAVRDLSSDDF